MRAAQQELPRADAASMLDLCQIISSANSSLLLFLRTRGVMCGGDCRPAFPCWITKLNSELRCAVAFSTSTGFSSHSPHRQH